MAAPILFFGDGSAPIHPSFSRLLQARREDSLLALFLERARLALQDEIYRLPVADRKGLPDLAQLEDLILPPGHRLPDHQCIAPAMLVMLQLGELIGLYEATPEEPYPDPAVAIIVGICVGQISAFAVSQARSLTELLPVAVESVRLAFRTGVTATVVKDDLEPSKPDASWAMTVSKEIGLLENDLLSTIHRDLDVTERKKAYVSAAFRKGLTLQGPPSTLDGIEQWLSTHRKAGQKSGHQRLPIYSPYHAPHLYSDEDILHIISSSGRPDRTPSKFTQNGKAPRLVSPVTGDFYPGVQRYELLENVLHDTLREPINWEIVVAGCQRHVRASYEQVWEIKPFGPAMLARALVAALNTEADIEAILNDGFSLVCSALSRSSNREPLAIVGMAGRFPDSMNHDELWRLLEKGIDCAKVIPSDRFDSDLYISRDGQARNPTGTAYGCFMKQPGFFDARFFNMSPREAEQTDPQQRLILTTAHEALEMSGFVANRTPSTQLDQVGTYYGQTADDYREINASQDIQTYYVTGNDRAFGPGRINYHFKFGGPSVCVDTACSSSAVALNIACNALWAKECSTAVVGGMLLMTSPDSFCGLTSAHFANSTGNCKTFDDAADGYCRGEAIGTIIVKRLSDATADNDKILATVLAAGTNHSANAAHLTHPHGPTQETLYKRLLHQAGLQPIDVDLVEMHGTGTQAGDATEMSSVSNVFAPASPRRPANQPLWLSATKANLGHAESASGITALIKTLLVLREQKIPPHIGIKSTVINRTFPNLEERNIRLALNGVETLHRPHERRLHALINNFGAAGGNTAFLLAEAPTTKPVSSTDPRTHHVINVSAKSKASMASNIRNLMTYIADHPTTSLPDLSYTTTARRIQFPLGISVVGSTLADVQNHLKSALDQETFHPNQKATKIVYIFTGQGSLYLPLGKALFEKSKKFRSDLSRFDQLCRDQDLPSILRVVVGTEDDLNSLSAAQTQLAMVAVQMCLYRLWTSWGVRPTAVIGHSLGEYAALFVSGVLSASDTLYLVGQRAQLLEALCRKNTHGMVSVHCGLEQLETVIGKTLGSLEVACKNTPQDVVLSGPIEKITLARDDFKAAGLKCTILNTPFAFHSAQVDPILDAFEAAARGVTYMTPDIPILSPLLCEIIQANGIVGPSYLRRHAREVVDFSTVLQTARSHNLVDEGTIWLEIGPSPVCVGMVQSTLGSTCRVGASLRKNEDALTTTAKTASYLQNQGVQIDWNEYHRDFEVNLILLHIPSYAFDEKNYWIPYKNDWALRKGDDVTRPDTSPSKTSRINTGVHRLRSKDVLGNLVSLVFETDLSDPDLHAMIAGHRLNGQAMCPAGVYADMALTVADYVRREYKIQVPASGINITEMEVRGPVTVPVPRLPTPQLLHLTAQADLTTGVTHLEYGIFSPVTGLADTNATCRIEVGDEKSWLQAWSLTKYLISSRIDALQRGLREGTTDRIGKRLIYQLFSSLVVYGEEYRGMQEVLVDGNNSEAIASIILHSGENTGQYFANPLWLDNLAQVAGLIMNSICNTEPSTNVYITHGWQTCQIAMPMDPTRPYQVHVKMQPIGESLMIGDASILQDSVMVGLVGGLKFQRVPRSLLDAMLSPASSSPKTLQKTNEPKKATAPIRVPHATPQLIRHASQADQVLAQIAKEVGISTSDLTDSTNFEDLGVDSLMSLTILSSLRETLHIDLPPSIFHDVPTVGNLRRLMNDSPDESTDSGVITPPSLSDPHVAVVGNQVDVVYDTISELTGITIDELRTCDDLSAVGVDSMTSLSIISALREKLNVELSPDLLQGDLSVPRIEKALQLPIQPTAPRALPRTKPSSDTVLLQGNARTASRKMFLFPDGSGSATSYMFLPEIASGTCVFGVNSPFLKRPDEYTCSLEEATLIMVEALRSRQPHGPYIIAGWSAGGMYAFEAARHLIMAGETVLKLILMDSPCRLTYGPIPSDVLNYISTSGVITGNSEGTAPQWLVKHFRETVRAIGDYAPEPIPASKAPPTSLIWARRGLFQDWPEAENAGLDLVDATSSWLLRPKTGYGGQGWERLLSCDSLPCVVVEGNHFNMVHAPQSISLSKAIADAISDIE